MASLPQTHTGRLPRLESRQYQQNCPKDDRAHRAEAVGVTMSACISGLLESIPLPQSPLNRFQELCAMAKYV